MIVIVDYGMGNLGSILNRLHRMGVEAVVSSKDADIKKATKLILPGVGFFATGMDNLHKYGLLAALQKKVVEERTPVLGICLGMQLMTMKSEEGDAEGLGWIDAETKKFDFESKGIKLRIPHMGWNSIEIVRDSPIVAELPDEASYYFVHSYYVECRNTDDMIAVTHYGWDFASVVQKGNIFGTQFHPEKSHGNGIALLKNFVERV